MHRFDRRLEIRQLNLCKTFRGKNINDLWAPLLEVVGEEDEDGEEHGEGDGEDHQQAGVNHSRQLSRF